MQGRQADSALAMDASGGAFAVWEDRRNDAGDIYAQRVKDNGETYWPIPNDTIGVAVYTGALQQAAPQVVSDDNGGFLAAWRDQQPAPAELHVARFHGTGINAWNSDIKVGDISSPLNSLSSFAIDRDRDGGVVLAWETGFDIHGQRIEAAGGMVWATGGNGVSVTAGGGPNHQRTAPAIAGFDDGGAVVAWATYFHDTANDTNIYSLQISPYGLVSGVAGGNTVSNAPDNQNAPAVLNNGLCESKYAWADLRSGDAGVYMQRRARQWYRCLPRINDTWITVDSHSDLVPMKTMKLEVVGHTNGYEPPPSEGGRFDLAYDPEFLDVAGVRLESGILAGATVSVDLETPGLVRLEVLADFQLVEDALLFEVILTPLVATGSTFANLTTAELGGDPVQVESGRLEFTP